MLLSSILALNIAVVVAVILVSFDFAYILHILSNYILVILFYFLYLNNLSNSFLIVILYYSCHV